MSHPAVSQFSSQLSLEVIKEILKKKYTLVDAEMNTENTSVGCRYNHTVYCHKAVIIIDLQQLCRTSRDIKDNMAKSLMADKFIWPHCIYLNLLFTASHSHSCSHSYLEAEPAHPQSDLVASEQLHWSN